MWPFSNWSECTYIAQTTSWKRAERSARIAEGLSLAGRDVSPSEDAPYLCTDATTIVSKIKNGEWSCKRVMQAYIRSSARAQERTNCLTEVLYTQALNEAEEMDRWIASASTEELAKKLLLGLPMSLKDQVNVKGYDSTIGFTRYCNQPSEEDAVLLELLRSQGAIPFCKTNVPQTMLAFECSNPLFGKTSNPYSPLHVPGGSSGGEAALLGSDGSPLGIGSDIGGSLRIPAHYSGCYALKPVYGRIPGRGNRGTAVGYEAVRSTLGPMGRNIDDLELCMKATSAAMMERGAYSTENNTIPLPFREVSLPKRLRFGYYMEDDFIPTSPACERAVNTTIQALQAAGHECVPVKIPTPIESLVLFQALASSDGYDTLTSHLFASEYREPALFLPTLGSKVPSWLRTFVQWLLRAVASEHAMARLVGVSREKRTKEVWKWQKQKDDYAAKVRRLLWQSVEKGGLGLDGVICPVQASPAVTHGATKRLSPLAIHTILWNVVDSSVGVIPITRVDEQKDILPSSFVERIRKAGTKLLTRLLYKDVYDAKAMHGLPVGVQIVGPALAEEKVLQMMKVVDQAVNPDKQSVQAFGPGRYGNHVKVY